MFPIPLAPHLSLTYLFLLSLLSPACILTTQKTHVPAILGHPFSV